MGALEYYLSPDGEDIIISKNGNHSLLSSEDSDTITFLYREIEMRYPDAFKRLNEIFCQHREFMFLVVKRFIKCNWGKADEQPDINGNEWNLEKVQCPLRGGFCCDERVICLPRLSTGLTPRELDIIKLAHMPVKDISSRLFISPYTVENHIANISRKLNVSGKSELVKYAHQNRLV